MPLTITSEPGQGFVTIRPAGSLDSNTYTQLEEHIAAVTKSKPGALVLDLKGLSYISSAGVRVLIAAQKAMKAIGSGFAIVNLQPQIRKVFEIIMALPSPNVFESVADLDRYLAGIQRKMLGKDEA
jgi:anti-sigma B factor antagonist